MLNRIIKYDDNKIKDDHMILEKDLYHSFCIFIKPYYLIIESIVLNRAFNLQPKYHSSSVLFNPMTANSQWNEIFRHYYQKLWVRIFTLMYQTEFVFFDNNVIEY